jgi:ribose 5-phosphate isomerase B
MKIFIAADHAGYDMKKMLKEFLSSLGHEVIDKGAFERDLQDDYPDYMRPLADDVAKDPEHTCGIIIGGSGQGEAMTANRVKGVRAAVIYHYDEREITLSKEHNNANVLALGARFLTDEEARNAVKLWLATPFTFDERHIRRLKKLDE